MAKTNIFHHLFIFIILCCIELHPWLWCLFVSTDDDPGPGTSVATGFGYNPKPVFKYHINGTITVMV